MALQQQEATCLGAWRLQARGEFNANFISPAAGDCTGVALISVHVNGWVRWGFAPNATDTFADFTQLWDNSMAGRTITPAGIDPFIAPAFENLSASSSDPWYWSGSDRSYFVTHNIASLTAAALPRTLSVSVAPEPDPAPECDLRLTIQRNQICFETVPYTPTIGHMTRAMAGKHVLIRGVTLQLGKSLRQEVLDDGKFLVCFENRDPQSLTCEDFDLVDAPANTYLQATGRAGPEPNDFTVCYTAGASVTRACGTGPGKVRQRADGYTDITVADTSAVGIEVGTMLEIMHGATTYDVEIVEIATGRLVLQNSGATYLSAASGETVTIKILAS